MKEKISAAQIREIAIDLNLRLGPNDNLVNVAGETTQRAWMGAPLTLADRALLGMCVQATKQIAQEEEAGTAKFPDYDAKVARWEHDVREVVENLLIQTT